MMKKVFIFLIVILILALIFHSLKDFFVVEEEYKFNQTVKEFTPILEFKMENESLKRAESTLILHESSSCPKKYPIYFRGLCYEKCEIGYLQIYENRTGKCIHFQPEVDIIYKKLVDAFVSYECEEKIDPEGLKEFTISLLPNYGASTFPYLLYNFLLYKWIKENIRYLPGSYSEALPPNETLKLKAGKCDDQAILFASMSASIGSFVRIRYVINCHHAWAEVFFPTKNIEDLINELSFYSKEKEFQYFETEDGVWIPFDTTYKIGKIIENCLHFLNTSIIKYYCKNPCKKEYPFYYNGSCYNKCPGGTGVGNKDYICLDCPKDYPFTYNNKCVNICPNGTGLASDNKTCVECPEGYQTYNNTCVTCPEGFYIGKDGKCYKRV